MKKILLVNVAVLFTCVLHAQVSLNLQLPTLGLIIKPQLWNMSLINASGQPMNVSLQMVMTDAAGGQTVLTGSTPVFTIPAGVKMITLNDISPVTYTAGAGYAIDATPNGFLPVGVYNICFILTHHATETTDPVADECMTAEVEPVSPPQLMQPADSEHLTVRRPFFTWLPPLPFNVFNNLLYDYTLVEVQPTQAASDAIQQNIPVYQQSNISFTSLQYPLSMSELDTGKLYAWRVTAKNNSMPVANSEIWSFRIQPFATDTIKAVSRGYYVALRRQPDASYTLCSGVLRFQYQQEMNDSTVQIHITDITKAGQPQVELNTAAYHVKYGLNEMQLDLSDASGMVNQHMYLMELTNARNEKWYLKFEYRSR